MYSLPVAYPHDAHTTVAPEVLPDVSQELQQAGTFADSDKSYVDHARAQLESIRAERAAMK